MELSQLYGVKKRQLLLKYAQAVGFLAVVATVFSFFAQSGVMFVPPGDITNDFEIFHYLVFNIVIPYFVLFFTIVPTTWWVLSQKNFKYIRFLFSESLPGLVTSYLVMTTLVIFVTALTLNYLPSDYFVLIDQYGMNRAQILLWNVTVLSMSIPMWVGYREGWISYRSIGASTAQSRYENYLRSLEVESTGQFWDRTVMRIYSFVTGSDGGKPRGGFFWFFFVGMTGVTFLWTFSTLLGFPYLIGISVFLIMPSVLMLFAAFAKWRDGRSVKRAPVLVPVRGEGYGDDFIPSSMGVRVFDRRTK